MKKVMWASLIALIVFACNKKESVAKESATTVAAKAATSAIESSMDPGCEKEFITDQPVKAGETGLVLPVGTKLCFTANPSEVRVTLPADFTFITEGTSEKAAPVLYATYTCICSVERSACQVFYASGLGFGCLQSSCTGSCTGKFTYKGYTVDKIVPISDKESFFQLPEVQKEISTMTTQMPYEERSVFGVKFFLVNAEKIFLGSAKCDCEGTAGCRLKSISIPLGPKIYFCEGPCNGCELTV